MGIETQNLQKNKRVTLIYDIITLDDKTRDKVQGNSNTR